MTWEHTLEERCPTWTYQPSFADLISKYRALHQKFAFEDTAGSSPLTGCEAAEKDRSSPLVSEHNKCSRLCFCCSRLHKTLKELDQIVSRPKSLDCVCVLSTG